jgi:D-alanine-D-alanine ligase
MLRKDLNIGLIFGGDSTEHNISIGSAYFIYQELKDSGWKVTPLYWSKDRLIHYSTNPSPNFPPLSENVSNRSTDWESFVQKNWDAIPLYELSNLKLDFLFLGLHGGSGENGTIQGFCEANQMAYSGSGILASSLAMDKYRSNLIFESLGIKLAPFMEWNTNTKGKPELPFSYPIFAKPTTGGSSFFTSKLQSESDLDSYLSSVNGKIDRILFQKFVPGKEYSCGVIVEKNGPKWITRPLVSTEISPSSEFFDFQSKYQKGGSKEITPSPISSDLEERIQSMALLAHIALGCEGYSRSDFIIDNNDIYILETNTLPGMTSTSLLPQQAKALNIEMKLIFDNLIQYGLERINHLK